MPAPRTTSTAETLTACRLLTHHVAVPCAVEDNNIKASTIFGFESGIMSQHQGTPSELAATAFGAKIAPVLTYLDTHVMSPPHGINFHYKQGTLLSSAQNKLLPGQRGEYKL